MNTTQPSPLFQSDLAPCILSAAGRDRLITLYDFIEKLGSLPLYGKYALRASITNHHSRREDFEP